MSIFIQDNAIIIDISGNQHNITGLNFSDKDSIINTITNYIKLNFTTDNDIERISEILKMLDSIYSSPLNQNQSSLSPTGSQPVSQPVSPTGSPTGSQPVSQPVSQPNGQPANNSEKLQNALKTKIIEALKSSGTSPTPENRLSDLVKPMLAQALKGITPTAVVAQQPTAVVAPAADILNQVRKDTTESAIKTNAMDSVLAEIEKQMPVEREAPSQDKSIEIPIKDSAINTVVGEIGDKRLTNFAAQFVKEQIKQPDVSNTPPSA
jgi:hypothetical protein